MIHIMNKRRLEINVYTPPRKKQCLTHELVPEPDNSNSLSDMFDMAMYEYYRELDQRFEVDENWMPYIL